MGYCHMEQTLWGFCVCKSGFSNMMAKQAKGHLTERKGKALQKSWREFFFLLISPWSTLLVDINKATFNKCAGISISTLIICIQLIHIQKYPPWTQLRFNAGKLVMESCITKISSLNTNILQSIYQCTVKYYE